jgi:crotonobetainyl-CoA:carnitine CoA-transferase CaiB-like acyl-CoA transferase
MGRDDLVDDERFRTRDQRVKRAGEVHEMISSWSKGLSVAEAVEALSERGVPAAEVRDPSKAVRDPLVRAREEVVPIEHPVYGAVADLSATGVPIRFSGAQVGLHTPPPVLGEHNGHIYRDMLGYSDEQLAALAEQSVI